MRNTTKARFTSHKNLLVGGSLLALSAMTGACGAANSGVQGSPIVSHPDVPGTVFTIIFENHDQGQVLNTQVPYFNELAQTYGSAAAYVENIHPSLPNYIKLTSGSTQGVTDDRGPSAHPIAGTDNLGDQLDAAGIRWRAYMESAGTSCATSDNGDYVARHNPFVYYTSLSSDTARCNDRIVDFDAHFTEDLASNTYRFMWITPNLVSDMHDGTPQQADAWLRRVVTQIMASPGYQNGGAIFILFDEGSFSLNYVFGTPTNLAAIVVSPQLASQPFQSNTTFDHRSYLATIEDIFGMPRLATTADATPMNEFFRRSNAP